MSLAGEVVDVVLGADDIFFSSKFPIKKQNTLSTEAILRESASVGNLVTTIKMGFASPDQVN